MYGRTNYTGTAKQGLKEHEEKMLGNRQENELRTKDWKTALHKD